MAVALSLRSDSRRLDVLVYLVCNLSTYVYVCNAYTHDVYSLARCYVVVFIGMNAVLALGGLDGNISG